MNKKLNIFGIDGRHFCYPRMPQSELLNKNAETDDSWFMSSSDDSKSEDGNDLTKELHEKIAQEQLALDALNDWSSITQTVGLVPEHVETRSLYNPETGAELEQVKSYSG